MRGFTGPLRLQGADFFLPGHAPVRSMPVWLDGGIPLHEHDFVEIAIVAGGTAVHRTIFGDEPVKPGDAIVVRPGAWHGYRDADGLQMYDVRFGLDLLVAGELAWDDPAVDQLFCTAPTSADRRGFVHIAMPEPQLIEAATVAGQIHAAVTLDGALGRAEEVAMIHDLVLVVARAAATAGARRGKPEPHQAVTDGIRLMAADLRRDWTLPDVAAKLGVDKSYLVRLFRGQTGLPPMQFLAKMRAEWAAELLLRTARDVAVIGQQVGWDDPNYFARRFKAEFGVSATRFRADFAWM